MRIIFLLAMLVSAHVQAECSIWELGSRVGDSVSMDTIRAISYLEEAFVNPELLHSPAFRDRLARAMEAAGLNVKTYLAPPAEHGPIPSKELVGSWIEDLRKVVFCS